MRHCTHAVRRLIATALATVALTLSLLLSGDAPAAVRQPAGIPDLAGMTLQLEDLPAGTTVDSQGYIRFPGTVAAYDRTFILPSGSGLEWIDGMDSRELLGFEEGDDLVFKADVPNYFLQSASVQYTGDKWQVTAAGPTTSIREEPYQGEIIRRYGVRAVIGKGGMGAKTLAALQEHGAVYLNAIGGAAQFYARTITGVDDVSLLEFGTPEAMWHLQVQDFPAIVTMDAHGNSLHKDVEQASGEELAQLAVSS